jgi:hypothetical protein
MANDFAAIQTAFLAPQRGFAISLDDTMDIVMIHYFGKSAVNLAAARGRNRWQPVPGSCIGPAPQMSDLAHERTIVLMNALSELLEVRDDGIVREIDNAGGGGRVPGHGGRAAEHGQGDATPGFFFVVELVALLRSTIDRIQHRVTGTHDPVLERQMTQ